MPPRLTRKRTTERRLAAVLAADVAGWSRLMGADEEGTLRRLRAHRRQLLDRKLAEHRGRLVKTTGDGLLAEFASPVQALRCAVEMQQGMRERNADEPPERRIAFRIGINLGDIIVAEDGDIFGDGVNIAARLEALAEPGGICIAGAVRDHVRDRLPVALEDLGEQRVKNIARPVRCYRVRFETYRIAAPAAARSRRAGRGPALPAAAIAVLLVAAGALWWRFGPPSAPAPEISPASPTAASGPAIPAAEMPRLSILVLPFANPGGGPEQDYVADAVTAGLTAELSRIGGAFAIDPGTAFVFKDKGIAPREAARALGVRYAVAGGLRRAGERVHLDAEMIDAETGAVLWSERFEDDPARLPALIGAAVAGIARALDAPLSAAGRDRANDPEAVDLTMRGLALLRRSGREDGAAAARALFERALAIDDTLADAWTGLARTHLRAAGDGGEVPPAALERAEAALSWALALDPDSARAHAARGVLFRLQGKLEAAVAEAERAIALNRNEASVHADLALVKAWLGMPGPALAAIRQAIRLSPRDPELGRWTALLGFVQFMLGREADAIAALESAVALDPALSGAHADLAALYALTGREDKARAALAALHRLRPDLTLARLRGEAPSEHPAYLAARERLHAGLRAAGMAP